ncbi:MAG: hypothetical protein P4L56_05785 [Candidatus Sulfopaludibacter sp.]|nr:hypothetical protein [Candidatus Sulfopaludibacter sp.]
MKQESTSGAYCKVCLLAHDEELHRATLAVREWHRWQVTKGFEAARNEDVPVEELAEPRVA